MKNLQRKTLAVLSAFGLSILATGCGGEAYRPVANNGASAPTNAYPNPIPTYTPTVDPNWGGGTGGTGPTVTPVTGIPAYTYSFSVTGADGNNPSYQAPAVETDNLLRVRISAGPGEKVSIPQYSNFVGQYDCVQYKVEALGQAQWTPILSLSGAGNPYCPGSVSFADLDFSSRLGSGHNSVNVNVTAVRSDYYCKLYFGGYMPHLTREWAIANYCPVSSVYRTHVVTGKMQVQVNGTVFSTF